MRDVWVWYRRSSRMTLIGRTSLNSRTDCIFDMTVRSWNRYWLDPLTFINVRLAKGAMERERRAAQEKYRVRAQRREFNRQTQESHP